MKELLKKSSTLKRYLGKNTNRYVCLETNRDCNRRCPECMVPKSYDKESESTLAETKNQIDWLYKEGFRLLSYVGGEPLAPFKTKEGITFLEHTLGAVQHASKRGMIVSVTTNGDYVNEGVVKLLKSAGLDSLTFSLHSFGEKELTRLIDEARMTAKIGIVPTIHALLTSKNADILPDIAFRVAENGILFSTAIIQEKGKGFSAIPEQSQMPTVEQAKKTFNSLLKLKSYGFVLTDRNYLMDAPSYIENPWKCNPKKDYFIHIGGGYLNVCAESRTDIKTTDTNLSDTKWRERKQELVRNCEGCNYQCWREAEKPNLITSIPTLAIMGLIKSGRARTAERLGKFAVQRIRNSTSKIQY